MGHDKHSCNIIQVHSTAFALYSWIAIEPTSTPTRSCCCICLTDFSDLAIEPAGDNNTSSSLPSCASLLYSYQLRQLAGVTVSCYPHNWRPWIQRHTIATHTHVTDRAVFAMLGVVKTTEKKTFIVHFCTHRQGGTKWQNVPGRKSTHLKDLIRNTGSI